jgi:hybrid cluster-associated redox disulfide protein
MKKQKKKSPYKSKSPKSKKKEQKSLVKITKSMSFGEILNRYPKAGEILMKKGLHCIGCGMAMFESLEQGAIMHGINPDKLVQELNKKLGIK